MYYWSLDNKTITAIIIVFERIVIVSLIIPVCNYLLYPHAIQIWLIQCVGFLVISFSFSLLASSSLPNATSVVHAASRRMHD
jgi:hypothetical protein